MPRGRPLHRYADGLQLVPPGELRGHDEPEPRDVGLPDAVPDLPHDHGVAAGELRPPGDAVPADRRAQPNGLREVPRGRSLRGDADRLLLVPSGELRAHHEPEPPGLRVSHAVPDLSHHERVEARDRRSQQDALPAHRCAQRVDCARCHVGGRYSGTPTDCYSCHQANYARTTNPNHQASAFPTQCQTCHTTSAWRPATSDHNKTRFPLTGAHQRVDCARCHVGGRYTGTPTDCNSCHQANYAATTNPNHRSAGFPVSCQNCHTTSAWRPATFDHDGRYFPIYSGTHRGKWTNCSECHVSAGNYKAFECILCHEHSNKAKVDSDHKGESGLRVREHVLLPVPPERSRRTPPAASAACLEEGFNGHPQTRRAAARPGPGRGASRSLTRGGSSSPPAGCRLSPSTAVASRGEARATGSAW